MNKLMKALVALGSVAATTAAVAGPAGAAATSPHYYLALGDSLAQGVQPDANGISLETDRGYVDDIEKAQLNRDPSLEVVKLGCPGETTSSYLHGGVCPTPYYSQSSAAVRFLQKYGSQTSFVTIDIGANNVDGCAAGGVINGACIAQGVDEARAQLPIILSKLQAADPGVKIYGMNYYDPFLAAYLLGPSGQALASESIVLTEEFNGLLDGIYAQYGIPVADVQDRPFATTDTTFSQGLNIGGTPVPDNVGRLCALTFNCTPPPQGPNIHAKTVGYEAIARDFVALINAPAGS